MAQSGQLPLKKKRLTIPSRPKNLRVAAYARRQKQNTNQIFFAYINHVIRKNNKPSAYFFVKFPDMGKPKKIGQADQ